MVGCSGNPTNTRLHKVKQYGILPRKSWESLPNLNFLSALIPMPLTSFLLLSTALFALRSFFSSSAWIRREIVGLVLLSHKPTLLSLFLSAILISFWRFLINCFPSATNLRTSDGFSTLPSIWVKMLFKCEFTPPRSPSKGQTEKKSLTISNISPSLIFHVWSGKGCYVAWIFQVISLNLFGLLDNTCIINERDKDTRVKLFTRVWFRVFSDSFSFN